MSCLQAAESVLIHSVRGQPGNLVVDPTDSLTKPERGAAASPKCERVATVGEESGKDMHMKRTKDRH